MSLFVTFYLDALHLPIFLQSDVLYVRVFSCGALLIGKFRFYGVRQHFLQCPQGLLNKHFEKLIQCDMRLNFLSQQPEIVLDSPYFESRPSVFEDPEESKDHSFDQVDSGRGSMSGFQDVASPPAIQSSSLKIEQMQDSAGSGFENRLREAPSPSSGKMTNFWSF